MAWVGQLRASAISRFASLGFPTERDEAWRLTRVDPIVETTFALAAQSASFKEQDIYALALASLCGIQLVFVDGRYQPELSRMPAFSGVLAASLAATLKSEPGKVEPYLAKRVGPEGAAFTALNTAFFNDGAFIYLSKNASADQPIHLLFISTASETPLMAHCRNLIVAEAGAKASIVEEYVGAGAGVYFTNVVTEIFADDNSELSHYKLQRESDKGLHIGTLQVHQQRDSRFMAHSISLGGSLVRQDVNVVLEAEDGQQGLDLLPLRRIEARPRWRRTQSSL